jgi:tetratricopeptide (TPR) repeat protein
MAPDCAECERLWRGYAQTIQARAAFKQLLETTHLLKAVYPDVSETSEEFEGALKKEQAAWEAIREHDATTGHVRVTAGSVAEWESRLRNSSDPLGLVQEVFEAARDQLKDRSKLARMATPNDALTWFTQAEILENQGRHEEAVLSYNKGLELEPGSWRGIAKVSNLPGWGDGMRR